MAYSLVERPEARYRVIHDLHPKRTTESDLSEATDGFLIESNGLRYDNFEVRKAYDLDSSSNLEKLLARSRFDILEAAKKLNSRVYFGDLPLAGFDVRDYTIPWPFGLRVAEYIAGFCAAGSMLDERKKEKFSRRDLLKLATKGIIAAWGMSIFINLPAAILLSQEGEASQIERGIACLDGKLHPEDPSLGLREAVHANKALFIGKKLANDLGRKAEISIDSGISHAELVELLKKGPEFCRDKIFSYPRGFLKLAISEGDLNYLSLIVSLEYKQEWNLWVVKEKFYETELFQKINREHETHKLGKERLI